MDAGIPVVVVPDLVPEGGPVDGDDLHVDAHLKQAGLHDLSSLLKVGAGPGDDPELTAVIVGSGEVLLGLFKVVGVGLVGAVRRPAGPGLVAENGWGIRLTVENGLVYGVLVDTILDSLAEVRVVACPAGLEEVVLQIAALEAQRGVPGDIRIIDVNQSIEREVEGDIRLAAFNGQNGGVVVGDGLDDAGLKGGGAVPVFVVALEDDLVAGDGADELVGTGADGGGIVALEAADFIPVLLT